MKSKNELIKTIREQNLELMNAKNMEDYRFLQGIFNGMFISIAFWIIIISVIWVLL